MPAVGQAFIIEPKAGRRIIQTYGMRALSAALTKLTFDDIHLVYAREIREAAEPIAQTASEKAPSTSGDFAGSISIKGGRMGAYLVSTDPGAGPIEFAGPADTPEQWPSYGRGDVLTEHWGEPARALFPAIEEHLEEVALKTSEVVSRTFQTLCSKDFSAYPDP